MTSKVTTYRFVKYSRGCRVPIKEVLVCDDSEIVIGTHVICHVNKIFESLRVMLKIRKNPEVCFLK